MVGGHPRSLEYPDALLCGGQSSYPDVTRRLASTLRDRLGVEDLDAWFAGHSQLDPALTEVVTLAADDVLLAEMPGAQRLLLGASVYRSAERGIVPTPPRRAPDGLRRLVGICAASNLLTPDTSAGEPTVFVHRWTATELHHRWGYSGQHDQLTEAHRRAADYWQWRVRVWP